MNNQPKDRIAKFHNFFSWILTAIFGLFSLIFAISPLILKNDFLGSWLQALMYAILAWVISPRSPIHWGIKSVIVVIVMFTL